MAVTIEKTEWGGWPNCYLITNGLVELIVTSDVGPRIMRYAFVGGENLFKEYTEQLGKSGEPDWQLRGGHRLWVAPENALRSYQPDNSPVDISIDGDVLTATQPVEGMTGIRKQMVIRLAAETSKVEVLHRLENTLAWPVEFAPWALTMMAQRGAGITGFPPRGTHPEMLEPTNPLIMWAFTDLSDPRYTLLRKYFVLRQDPDNAAPTKLGHFNEKTWGAYLLGTDLFIKQVKAEKGKPYPDMGCSYETFTRHDMLEIETLGPIAKVETGAAAEHLETWSLHSKVSIPEWTDAVLDAVLSPLLD